MASQGNKLDFQRFLENPKGEDLLGKIVIILFSNT